MNLMKRISFLLIISAFALLPLHAIAAPILQQVSPTPTEYVFGTDFNTAFGSGLGDVTAVAEAVDWDLGLGNSSTSGCETGDFAGFTSGNIALLQRGACLFATKVENAILAGAVGAIIFNQGNTVDRIAAVAISLAPYTDDAPVAIPVLSVSYPVGISLDGATVRMRVPVPATLGLLGIGLLGLRIFRRREVV
jgi:hypothetical protein